MGKWDALVKGALLHDIGKVVYRANQGTDAHSKSGATFIEPYFSDMGLKQSITHCLKYHHGKELSAAQLKMMIMHTLCMKRIILLLPWIVGILMRVKIPLHKNLIKSYRSNQFFVCLVVTLVINLYSITYVALMYLITLIILKAIKRYVHQVISIRHYMMC